MKKVLLTFILVFLPYIMLGQETIEITGTVTDNSMSLPGVNIVEKGTNNGTMTDFDGNYTIQTPSNAVLVISYMGYATREIEVNGKTNIDIVLEQDAAALDEVVVVGFGTQKKVNLTGSVASVDGDMLEDRPMTSVSAGLSGLLPGVSVNQSSGMPGNDGGTIRIRGTGTLNQASPMVVIDGVEGSLNDVQPNDIANISVLKDAASAAIYGSKAANGVILITTKTGKTGEPSVRLTSNFGWQSATRLPDYLGSYDYAVLYNEALTNSGKAPKFDENDLELFQNGSAPYSHPNTDWQDLLYQGSGFVTTNNLGISGGTEYTKYRASLNYQKQDGIIKHTGKDEYNARVNLTITPKKWLTTNLNLSYTQMDREQPNNAYVGGGLDQIIRQTNRIAPWIPYKNEDGTYGTISDGNPIAWIDMGPQINYNRKTFVGIGSIQADLFEGFNVKALMSHRNVEEDNSEMNKEIQYNENKYHGPTKLTEDLRTTTRNTLDLTANYNKIFENVHNVGALVGYHAESYDFKRTTAYRENFPSNELPNLDAGSTNGMKNTGYTRELNMTSWFGRLNYDYEGRYLFEANLRADASSRFAEDNRVGVFPSFSAGWRISDENFFEGIKSTVNNLKLRGSWGQLGNQDALNDYYPTVPTLGLGIDYPFNSEINSGAAIANAKNAALIWEKTTSYGLGIDARLLYKLNVTIDIYKKLTEGIIMQVPAPNEFALNNFYDNVGKLDNKGIEVSLDYTETFGEIDFGFGGNVAYNKNELVELAGTNEVISGRQIRKLGESLDSWYGYKTDGLHQTQEDIDVYATNTLYPGQIQPGDLRYVDITNDGKVDANDRVLLGNSTPTLNFGANLSLAYKNFDLLAIFQGATGGYGYMDFDAIGAVNGDGQKPSAMWLNRWTPENTNTNVPRLIDAINGPSMPQNSTTSYWLRSTDYLRMKNLQLGYNIPTNVLDGWNISKLRIYYTAQNLFTITNYLKGWDPEAPSGRGSGYPVVMTNSIGFNLTF
ncbi:SusC/RagA family TonB-linked outer membrane protein [Salegentibacter salegens]|uniref:TonB-linked outer membrane protein, SusC/RagA family n=1 Tax=Salegentibacter salegens TaxID=143223 RepID=A0A1M7NMB7_9FLAO|nr:TonB-dependent receptor [Salegentibacter salegens]PRX39274.1 TonB-linked SusC/RagA family outer membrane protein [Salegentibacter salegens]SHN05022.1 TonB-linked outer membrane protein, SusC/RagA family [Salegentibacter salegens]